MAPCCCSCRCMNGCGGLHTCVCVFAIVCAIVMLLAVAFVQHHFEIPGYQDAIADMLYKLQRMQCDIGVRAASRTVVQCARAYVCAR
jgi:hypothetical protein